MTEFLLGFAQSYHVMFFTIWCVKGYIKTDRKYGYSYKN